jgi:hypothetical protein
MTKETQITIKMDVRTSLEVLQVLDSATAGIVKSMLQKELYDFVRLCGI